MGDPLRGGATFELICGPRGDVLEQAELLEGAVAGEPAADDDASVVLAVTDNTGRVVGVARVLPCGSLWELASLTVRSSAQRTVSAALCHGVVQTLRVNRVRHLASADERAREQLEGVGLLLGRGGGRSVSEMIDGQRRINPEGYRLVTLGDGLDDVRLPHPAELLSPLAPVERELAPTG
jgi:hypothetical protein